MSGCCASSAESDTDEADKDKPIPTEDELGIAHHDYEIGKKEWDELYVEVLYTVEHKLGCGGGGAIGPGELHAYAQRAFNMPPESHRRLLALAREEKPPIPVLNVTVVEAQGLEAKDPNGFSDPYCMLGIQPASPRRSLRKLGASFKKKEPRSGSLESATVPAKFIRTTTVKPATLNPRWNERFRLDIDDVHADRLPSMDHDDESSVFDAARKLNEVTGLKGLGRYFKQIAQSARASPVDTVDDFLGCVNVALGVMDRWLPLEGRTHRSSIQGQIRLKLSLGTREDRGMTASIDDNWKEVVEHQELLWIFIEHELSLHEGPSHDWAGDLPRPALTILHQHAIQGDLTELQQAICRWVMYSRKHMGVSLDYALLYQLLDDLDKAWDDTERPLSRDEEACLAEAFNVFIDYCLELLHKHRDLFPMTHVEAEHKLAHLLKCLALIYRMKAFQWCCPFRNQLSVEIVNTLKVRASLAWCSRNRMERAPLEVYLGEFYLGITKLKYIFSACEIYIFIFFLFRYVGVNYTAVVYKQLDKLVGVNTVDSAAQDLSAEHISMGAALFELYMALQEFVRFREHLPREDWDQLSIQNFHLWFADSVQGWFAVAKVKARQRIRKALELDRIKFVDSFVQHSTSAVDTTTCFVQIKEFWRQLAWPDLQGSYPFVFKILEAVCDGAMFYANLCHQKLLNAGYYDEEGQFDVCIVINNMEHVRRALRPLHEELDLDHIVGAIEVSEGDRQADKCRAAFQGLLHGAEEDVVHKILTIIAGLSEKVMERVAYLSSICSGAALGPLVDYLDTNLKTLYQSLMRVNFYRTLEAVWRVVLQELTLTARNNLGERAGFFQRLFSSLGVLLEFFHAEDKGLSLKSLHSLPYQDLDRLLKLHKADTTDLVELYCLHRLEEQNRQIQQGASPYGWLTVRLGYNAAAECLCVDVMNARDLQPLDPNGNDPFVILEILPRHLFPDCPQQRTRVQKKTLFPLFDESFEFSVAQERCRQAVALLSFTVMDHDMMTRNDFEGEAFFALAAVPGVEESPPVAPAQPVDLPLVQPREKNEILCALESRTWDKEAQEFVKQQKKRRS
ncbi:munc13-4, putative [Ixodes scapularis]|uniref:Munc13-4, putative n=1 Tax=Ixodes scapularis TaxID=6945 RepID=B7PPK2_IXOSC|nr:munc13-4, putative [Ixodes scapularis]|eukprot:XP_002435694.1 munc13-4, putative [Ixodes scapularis]